MREIVSWILYSLGHSLYLLSSIVPERMMDIYLVRFFIGYPLYNWLMVKSFEIQGESQGPWNLT